MSELTDREKELKTQVAQCHQTIELMAAAGVKQDDELEYYKALCENLYEQIDVLKCWIKRQS